MKIIYVHHAERNLSYSKDLNLRNKDDITLDGIKEAMLLAKKLKKINVTSIITSPYLRCRHTAEILNEGLNVNIIDIIGYSPEDSIVSFGTQTGLDRSCSGP